jgi:hypothetical protein
MFMLVGKGLDLMINSLGSGGSLYSNATHLVTKILERCGRRNEIPNNTPHVNFLVSELLRDGYQARVQSIAAGPHIDS